jgi:GLPGLI family protein
MLATLIAGGCLTSAVQAQVRITINKGDAMQIKTTPIDKTLFTAQYRMTFVADTTKRDKPLTEMMMLNVGANTSLFHSYSKQVVDSIISEHLKAGLNPGTLGDKLRGIGGQIVYKIYKNYPQGKVTTLEEITINRFRCEEENAVPEWELAEDTLTVLSYLCQKATCSFKGRNYTAWFTTDIPRSEGPWKLHGLPGLIMKAEDERGDYAFECIAIVNAPDDESILYGDNGYEPISRTNFNKQMERYAADPIGYMTDGAPNVKVVMKNEAGENIRPTNTPYNPIELAEK